VASPTLLCVVVARDSAADLPAFLESAARFADGVVALDHHSADGTRELLDAHPLVRRVLEADPAGASSGDGIARVVEAAGAEGADWIMVLRPGECLDGDDAAALRAFVDGDADPASLYLFRIYRMVGDLGHYDDARSGVGRLFACTPGLGTAAAPIAPNGVPASIPTNRHCRTTIRIQDTSAARAGAWSAAPASPDRSGPRADVKPWWPRPAGFPVLANTPFPLDPTTLDPRAPLLSAIVIARDDEATIERSVRAAVEQECAEGFEVIVIASGTDRTAQIVRERFPTVRLIELDHPALPGEARNAGWRVARGRFVTFPGSHVEVLPGYYAAQIHSHLRGYAMVCGRLANGNSTGPGWAAFFLENGSVLPGRPSQPLDAPPPRCSYLRSAIVEVGGFPEDMRTNEDTAVILELFHRGYSAYFNRDQQLIHYGPCTTTAKLFRHFFKRGRGLGSLLLHEAELERRVPSRRMRRFVVANLPSRLRSVHLDVRRWGNGLRGRYWRTLLLIGIGAVGWWLGGCYEFARSGPAARRRVRRDRTSNRASS